MKKIKFLIILFIFINLLNFSLAIDCTDSDGGYEIYEKGEITGQRWGSGQYVVNEQREEVWVDPEIITVSDYCATKIEKGLVEYACYGGKVHSKFYGLEEGCLSCENGVCIDDIPDISCTENQCKRNKICYEIGDGTKHNITIKYCDNEECYQVAQEESYIFEEYCGEDGIMRMRKVIGEKCTYDYECGNNICVNNKCIDSIGRGIFEKFLAWLAGLFG